jgi:hypothetical protein
MIAPVLTDELVRVVADEMSRGVEIAVDRWMADVEEALDDHRLTTLGRMYAIRNIVERYKLLTGKTDLRVRRAG